MSKHAWICLTTAALLSLFGCRSEPPPTETLFSPNAQYSVVFSGSKGQPRLPFVYHTLTGTVQANGTTLCSDVDVYEADFFDTPFEKRYPRLLWPVDNVLRLEANWERSNVLDKLVVRNDSSHTLPCVRIRLVDMFLIMNLAHGALIATDVSRQPGGGVWFDVEVREGSALVLHEQRHFDRSDYPDGPLTCTVTIRENDLSLEVVGAKTARH